MLTYEARRRVSRPPEAVFDVIGTHVYDHAGARWRGQQRSVCPGPRGAEERLPADDSPGEAQPTEDQ